jgi:Holliday junction resolvasome RuvABC endonuclease subunit
MLVTGVDPGKSGAAAWIQDGKLKAVYPFKGDLNRCRLYPVIEPIGIVYIETVTASPQMGVVSAFTFGRYAEAVETSAYVHDLKINKVRPATWQNAIGCFAEGDKKKLYERAKELFPTQHKERMFNKDTADAVLIAYYGWRCELINRLKNA